MEGVARQELIDRMKGDKEWNDYVNREDLSVEQWRELTPRPGTPEFRRLEFEALDVPVRNVIRNAVIDFGDSFNADEYMDQVMSDNAGRIYYNKKTKRILTGQEALKMREADRTQWAAEENSAQFGKKRSEFEYEGDGRGVMISELKNRVKELTRKGSSLREQRWARRIEQNIFDGAYDELHTFGYLGYKDQNIFSDQGNVYRNKKAPGGEENFKKRKLVDEIYQFGKPIEEMTRYRMNLEQIEPETREFIEATMRHIYELAPDDAETYDLINHIQKNILMGEYSNGKLRAQRAESIEDSRYRDGFKFVWGEEMETAD